MISYPLKQLCLATVGFSLVLPVTSNAAVINAVINPGSTQGWNDSAVWGSAPTAANDYRSVSGFTALTPVYTVNGVTWSHSGTIRDVNDSAATRIVSTTFLGNSLLLSADTRLLGKGTGGSTQTVNLVMNGGFYHQAPSPATDASSTLAGTIIFGSSNIAALGVSAGSNGSFTWNVSSSVFGDQDDVLQLIIGGDANRLNFLNLNGNLGGFSGTIYMGVATSLTAPGSSFSLSSDALHAKVQLDYTTPNFQFNLGSGNATYGALALGSGSGTLVANGTYDSSQLNTLAGGEYFTGTGMITVVPEPGTATLAAMGALVGLAFLRRRNGNR